MDNLVIEHDQDAHRFFTTVDGHQAVLEYRPLSDDKLDYMRTFVPVEIRNRGIAKRLTEHALAYAADGGKRVVPSCWFVAKVMRENPKFAGIDAS